MLSSHQTPGITPVEQVSHPEFISGQRPLGFYIHIPFCDKKCPYCDFNTYAKLEHLHQSYVDALCQEMARWGDWMGHPELTTIFLGGGTPTVLSHAQLTQIVESLGRSFRLAEGYEFTSEANPGTVDQARFHHMRALGINRLSMGVQSFDSGELAFLGRIHSGPEAIRAFEAARKAGFDNINLDFMFGLPEQQLSTWQATLDQAMALEPEHLSLYSLIVEPDTPLHHWVQTGKVKEPDEDNAGDLYVAAQERMAQDGYQHYEVSNWAKASRDDTPIQPRFACRHNLIYWRNQDYLGVGPGAHSHLSRAWLTKLGPAIEERPLADDTHGLRWGNRKPVPGYIQRITSPVGEHPQITHPQITATVEAFREIIDSELSMGETMMLGLRLLKEGVSVIRFEQKHGYSLKEHYPKVLQRFFDLDLLCWVLDADGSERLCLTERGLMVGNQIFAEFLP